MPPGADDAVGARLVPATHVPSGAKERFLAKQRARQTGHARNWDMLSGEHS